MPENSHSVRTSFTGQDHSISGAQVFRSCHVSCNAVLTCSIRRKRIGATVVRNMEGTFAIKFNESLETRVTMIRTFYAGRYVQPFHGAHPMEVGRAIIGRFFS